MKSIYVQDEIHRSLKLIATLDKRPLTGVVEEFLQEQINRKLQDLPPEALAQLAASGQSFDFLNSADEDIYSETDGSPIMVD